MTHDFKELSEHNTAPRKPCGQCLQVSEGKRSGARVSAAMLVRIVHSLQNGEAERTIAERENTTEAFVRRVRSHEMARVDRALSTVRVGLANVIELVSENERDHWDEFLEAA